MKLDPNNTIFLIDGSSFLYRSYYALRPLHTPTGESVQAVYNFCRMIHKLIQRFSPHYIALVWDSKGKTQRHEIYEKYKATRQEAPSDLFTQKERIIAFAELIGLTNIAQPGVEADDIMMALAKACAEQGFTVVLVTSDKDMAQVLSDRILLYDPFKDRVFNARQFTEERGIAIERLPLYFALLGDASDNIPGVRGIGKKGALQIVQQFATLEELYENIEQLSTARMRNALLKEKDNAFLSRELFLPQSVTLEHGPDDLRFSPNAWENARPLFVELGFTSLLTLIGAQAKSEETTEELLRYMSKYRLMCVTTQQQLHEVATLLRSCDGFGLDTETDGPDAMRCRLVGLSVSCENKRAFYIPIAHQLAPSQQQIFAANTSPAQLSLAQVKEALGPLLMDGSIAKYLHNAKWDLHVLDRAGLSVKGIGCDTLVAARLVVQPWQRIGLKALAQYYLHDTMLTYKQVTGVGPYKSFDQVPLDLATIYGAADALETYRLVSIMHDELAQQGLQRLFNEVELPLVLVLFAMERTGITLSVQQLQQVSHEVDQQLALTEEKIQGFVAEYGVTINVNSSKQVAYLLFELLQLPPQKKGKTGYSTDQSVLEALASMHTVPGLILQYRELAKLKSTYLDSLPGYVDPQTGKIHTTFNQTTVATGRLSSSDPNLQNIPADGTRYGSAVRKAFVPTRGDLFIAADYSQIELRVLAHVSGDKTLVRAFCNDIDIHAQTAAALYNVPLDQVTHEQRQMGKRINFSILYGKTPYGLSKELDISLRDAKQYIDTYFRQYPGVTAWMDSIVAFAKRHGYVETVWGRRRYIPAIHESNQVLFNEAKRVAINTVAQGTAADLIKRAMVLLHERLQQEYPSAKMLLQIHDELLLSATEDTAEAVASLVKETLESVVQWTIPLRVTVRIGSNWAAVSK